MTREEAIKYLNEFIFFKKISNTTEGEVVECFKLAVEALQEHQHYKDLAESYEKTINKLTKAIAEPQPNEDCISRKEAIDALKQQAENMLCWSGRYTEQRKGILTAINIVSDLPSVAPQPKTEGARGDIPLQQSVPKMPQPSERTEERTETHECDCISRKDIGLTNLEILMCNGDYKEALKMLLDKIEKTPSVNPQQKTGHWIEHKHGGIEHIECSECHVWFLKADLPRKSYCPNCGSCNGDMIKNIMRDITKQ